MAEMYLFIFNSMLLGVGLAMDAFTVSVANALNDPGMPRRRMALIAGTFAFFQFLMPMVGWICVHTIVEAFAGFANIVPWIAFVLLLYIGVKMIRDGLSPEETEAVSSLSLGVLMLQGVATSIDALSVGFTIADYDLLPAFICALIISVVTFAICMAGLLLGRAAGEKLAGKAPIVGGVVLIVIGAEVLLKHLF